MGDDELSVGTLELQPRLRSRRSAAPAPFWWTARPSTAAPPDCAAWPRTEDPDRGRHLHRPRASRDFTRCSARSGWRAVSSAASARADSSWPSYALLERNKNPTNDEIKEALAGNICRCGEYPKILTSVEKAAAEMRGEKVTYTAPLMVEETAAVARRPYGRYSITAIRVRDAARARSSSSMNCSVELKQRPGIVGVVRHRSARSRQPGITRLDEARVRQILAESGHPVRS